jgi:hypothetical protein
MKWIKTSEKLPEFTKTDTNWKASDWVIVWDEKYKTPEIAYLEKYDYQDYFEWSTSDGFKPIDDYKLWTPIIPPETI